MQIVIASSNRHKVMEIKAALLPLLPAGCELIGLQSDAAEPEENGATFEENALIKARFYAQRLGCPALSDDSGLCVDALQGAPGIFSSRYGPTDAARITRLLAALSAAGTKEPRDRTARFICVAALAWPDGRSLVAQGVLDGSIAPAPAGSDGFGYDPVFFLDASAMTVAQLSADEKNSISHRSKALRKLASLITDSQT